MVLNDVERFFSMFQSNGHAGKAGDENAMSTVELNATFYKPLGIYRTERMTILLIIYRQLAR